MSKGKAYNIVITGMPEGGEYPPDEQLDFRSDWRNKLAEAYTNKVEAKVICQCKSQDEDLSLRRLVVRYLNDTNRYSLAAWKYSGGQHSHDCRYYSVWADEASEKSYTSRVVNMNPDGTFSITLPVGLSPNNRTVNPDPLVNPACHARTGKAKSSMSLLGLGHFIWQQAEINTWKPQFDKYKQRSELWLASRIDSTSQNIRVSKLKLSDVLLVSAAENGTQKKKNEQRVVYAMHNEKRMVIIALLKANANEGYAELKKGHLTLSNPEGFPKLNVSQNVFRACERSFNSELKAWEAGKPVVAILEIESLKPCTENINGCDVSITEANVIGIALMRVTARFIPVDSGYEEVIETHLYEQKRSFVKPLRYDAEEDTFPDFVLKDVAGNESLPMEVFGMRTKPYIERRKAKTEFYNKEYGAEGWWSWDATQKDPENNIPPFPSQTP